MTPADKEYGKYHYVAQNPDELASKLLEAVNAHHCPHQFVSQPRWCRSHVQRAATESTWHFSNRTRIIFGRETLPSSAFPQTLSIVDRDGNPATYPNGAIIDDAIPYWQTKDWANPLARTTISSIAIAKFILT